MWVMGLSEMWQNIKSVLVKSEKIDKNKEEYSQSWMSRSIS